MVLPFDTKTTKGQIIYCLSNEWPLSAKELHKAIRKKFERGITYQAVHKVVKELVNEKVLEKKERGYSLSTVWVDRMGEFLKNVKSSLLESKFDQIETVEKEADVREFYSIIDLARFLLFDFIQRPNLKKKGFVCWQRMYDLTGLSKEEIDTLRNSSKENKWVILCKRNNRVATMFSNTYKKMGLSVQFSNSLPEIDYDIWVWGDFIAQIHYPRYINIFWDAAFNIRRIIDLDFESLLHTTHQRLKNPVKVYVFKDKLLVQEYTRRFKPFS